MNLREKISDILAKDQPRQITISEIIRACDKHYNKEFEKRAQQENPLTFDENYKRYRI